MQALLPLASITDRMVESIVDVATELIGSAEVVAVLLLMALGSACIPVPSKAIMLFAGFAVSKRRTDPVRDRRRRRAGEPGRHLDRLRGRLLRGPRSAEKQAATVLFSPMLPIIRTFIPLLAAVAKMPVQAGRLTRPGVADRFSPTASTAARLLPSSGGDAASEKVECS
jgi:hypothetical protein